MGIHGWPLRAADLARRGAGAQLDALGLGPRTTPHRVVLRHRAFELRAYGGGGAALLIVPAPIKSSEIWDLAPDRSPVRRALEGGLRVYLVHWLAGGAELPGAGLDAYAGDYLDLCLDAIAAEHAGKPALAGHSLGGTLAAIYASLNRRRVRRLLLASSPLRFDPEAGAVEALTRVGPPPQALTAWLGPIPGSLLALGGFLAAPETFGGERMRDWWRSVGDPEAMLTQLRVERWTLAELPWPPRLYEDVVGELYRGNAFERGTLRVRGKVAALARLPRPVMVLAEARSRVVPPAAAVPAGLADREVEVLWYEGEPGVALQHLGVLLGREAHRELWPRVIRWLGEASPH